MESARHHRSRLDSLVHVGDAEQEDLRPFTDLATLDAQMHPFMMTFFDANTEARYSHFIYVQSGFYGGKAWHLTGLLINGLFYLFYHGIMQGWSTEMFVGRYWIGMLVMGIVLVFNMIGLFVERLFEYRESMFLVSLVFHWPAFTITSFYGMGKPWPFRWMFVLGCLFFCSFLTQARFSRIIWILGLTPILTILISSFAFGDYWKDMSLLEIWFWALLLVPPFALRIFERESRRSFLRKEQCERDVEGVELNIERTQDLIANLFAKTPTRDFLSVGKKMVRARRYNDTAMVVTDLAGFTAWTSVTRPAAVVDVLAAMFAYMDNSCKQYGVEKVSTVGDCFQGAVFPSEDDLALRCLHITQFGLDVLQSSGGVLPLRIGVHLGNITAAFVGSAPPKFDFFGEDFEVAKTMESAGVAGKVHGSSKFMESLSIIATPGGDVDKTADGVAFTELQSIKTAVDGSDDWSNHSDFFSPVQIHNICQALTRLAQKTKKKMPNLVGISSPTSRPRGSPRFEVATSYSSPFPQQDGDGTELLKREGTDDDLSGQHAAVTPRTPSGSMGHHSDRENTDSVTGSVSSMDGMDPEEIELKLLTLRFANPAEEQLYSQYVRRTGLVRRANLLLLGMEHAMMIAFVMLCCTDTDGNKLQFAAASAILYSYTFMEVLQFKTKHWSAITLSMYTFVAALIALTDSTCSETAKFYIAAVFAGLLQNAVLSLQFMLHFGIVWRVAGMFMFCTYGFLLLTIRKLALDDDRLNWDIVFYAGFIAFVFVSYCIDYSLRVAFVADRKLRIALRRTKGRFYQSTNVALDTMVPAFVSERLISNSAATALNTSSRAAFNEDSDSGEDEEGDAKAQMLLRRGSSKRQVWEFDDVCVMFASFQPTAASVDEELRITNVIFAELEAELQEFGVQKIKSIGTTLMCAYGMKKEKSPAFTMAQVAISLARKSLSRNMASNSISSYRLGLHCGPLFGAVLGTTSLMFDIFGDTVNLASRMTTTASNTSIQVSEALYSACSSHPVIKFTANPKVFVKGKGDVQTYNVVM